MKTTHSTEEIRHFLQTSKGADPSSIKSLQEGHSNQALYFENRTGDKLVLRIALGEDDFLHDKYVHEKLHDRLPVPKVLEIGMFGGDSFYCISEYIDGVPSDTIKQAEIDTMQPKILNAYAAIFTIDISGSSGYGPIDLKTDNGEFGSWHEKLACELKRLDAEHLEEREALYWAITALETIRFADTFEKQEISQWLHDYVASKLSNRTRSAERKELAVAHSLVETA